MKAFLTELRASLAGTIILVLVCCGLYPLAVWGIAQLAFPRQANGSLIRNADGSVVGSQLLGQPFAGAGYFHPRPSSAGGGYDAANSSGSNLGPTSRPLHDAIVARIASYRGENGLKESDSVPADAVTTSGSGLDPHIGIRNAELQIPRVAKARGLDQDRVRRMVQDHTAGPDLGLLGEFRVNVLTLNLALEGIAQAAQPPHVGNRELQK